MTTIKDGGPAFPRLGSLHDCRPGEKIAKYSADGMSLRDYFAGLAMQAWLGDNQSCRSLAGVAEKKGIPADEYIATQAYAMADAMLAQREKGGTSC